MIQSVVLDLDGPILEGKHRHYSCYKSILESAGYAALDLDEYWCCKRERIQAREILARTGAQAYYDAFHARWLEAIESSGALRLDTVHAGVRETLTSWSSGRMRLVLATLRRNQRSLRTQLDALDLSKYFTDVVVCDYDRGGEEKALRVAALVPPLKPDRTAWIGDTEVDVAGARTFGARAIVVTCGLRSESFLRSIVPDGIAPNLPAASALLR